MPAKKPSPFDKERNGTGTREWAEHSANIGTGCSHGCLYCYARHHALRFNLIGSPQEWTTEKTKHNLAGRRHGKKSGTIMFPTTHDITPHYLDAAIACLKGMLDAGNKVLVVSKPHIECIGRICDELTAHRESMLFRFTISSMDARLSKFWEPGAPSPRERLQCLLYAYKSGYRTSASMEPMLAGTTDAIVTCEKLSPYVTDTIWIGKMNKLRQRVDTSPPQVLQAVQRIEELQRDEEVLRLVHLTTNPKVRWKDSIKAIIERNRQ
jgi:DNA repair photolyase